MRSFDLPTIIFLDVWKMKSTLIYTLLPVVCMALSFADRNKNNLLFEYTFSETECENGLFTTTEYVAGSSFGNLTGGIALDCVARSGFRGKAVTSGYGFMSTSTFSAFRSRIYASLEYSLEMWIKNEDQDFMSARILSIGLVNQNGDSNDLLWSMQVFEDVLYFMPNYLSSGTYSAPVYNREGDGYVHFIISIKMRQSGTDITVLNDFLLWLISRFIEMERVFKTVPFVQPTTILGHLTIVF